MSGKIHSAISFINIYICPCFGARFWIDSESTAEQSVTTLDFGDKLKELSLLVVMLGSESFQIQNDLRSGL